MVSNDDIRSRLVAKREGLNSEDLKEESNLKRGYLVCDRCGSYYQLQKGESPEDFSFECDCGGRLTYKEFLDLNNEASESNSSSGRTLAILLVGGFAIFFLFYIFPIVYMLSAPFLVFGDSSQGAFIVVLLCLALVFSGIYTVYYLIKVILRTNT
jgi:hypothetical protein